MYKVTICKIVIIEVFSFIASTGQLFVPNSPDSSLEKIIWFSLGVMLPFAHLVQFKIAVLDLRIPSHAACNNMDLAALIDLFSISFKLIWFTKWNIKITERFKINGKKFLFVILLLSHISWYVTLTVFTKEVSPIIVTNGTIGSDKLSLCEIFPYYVSSDVLEFLRVYLKNILYGILSPMAIVFGVKNVISYVKIKIHQTEPIFLYFSVGWIVSEIMLLYCIVKKLKYNHTEYSPDELDFPFLSLMAHLFFSFLFCLKQLDRTLKCKINRLDTGIVKHEAELQKINV